ncbi:wax ester/triacylglycerol synthase family O-acyltransferase [Blastococcus sp. CT_GayMR16]|uniref:wax ester/triacylglycerol synthase family O-acyltransferase n=1 Tax=Blastococcus sp. CT_GayMR16 TaxID=2559607 RepID=UPI001073E74E|nr:wax ester/triacylglycerol synthase family O-acyltransferase [Blastococcus sp. CT_GayMR16]TFV87993.1 wax ester/triacylglycerol synthase family O-acyltransferase [Blastococcus sp. CT_GayMR16]
MTATSRMASADVAWLHMDRPTNLMVVNSVFWFDRPVDWDEVAAAFTDRLVPSFPRFGQRVLEPPITLGTLVPVWQDADDFDVENHLRRVRLPAPGRDEQLHAYVSAQASRPLDAGRPLWEAHLIDGYGEGCAVLLRTHHAIADGTALVQALLTLVDAPPEGAHLGQLPLVGEAPPVLPPPTPRPDPPSGSWLSRSVDALRLAADRNAMLRRLGFARPDDDSPLRGPLSGHKQLTWSPAIPLEPVKEAGRRSGATVNDLALSAVAGALRRYLQEQGRDVERLSVVVPVNLRPLDQPLDPGRGNQFGLAFVPLPVAEADPAARLAAVRVAMDTVKATGEGVVTAGALSVAGHTPIAVEQWWLDVFAGRATAVVTNIAGPRTDVSLAGVPLRGFTAWVPSTGPVGVGLSICSYAGKLLLGVSVDEALVPDSEVLLRALDEEVAALRELAR